MDRAGTTSSHKLPFMISVRRFTSVAAAALFTALGAALGVAPLHAQASPVGFWNAGTDDGGRPTAVVEIREVDGELVGFIREILVPATHEDSICGHCSDERKDQPIVGMEILRHMRPDGDAWSNGEILDPQNGKTYRAKMKLEDDGKRLVLRGYIGFSIFGRTQAWTRR
jgi:uncharacterized protein (DUF2147 family)